MTIKFSEKVVYKSISPKDIFAYSPNIYKLKNGRLIVTLDIGGDGVAFVDGVKGSRANGTKFGQGKIFVSDDDGKNWRFVVNFPFWHARVFEVKNSLYILGQAGSLKIIKSTDKGDTWSEVFDLTTLEKWHCAPCNILFYKNNLYIEVERRMNLKVKGWNVAGLSPFLIRCSLSKDLTRSDNWVISEPFTFLDKIHNDEISYFGIPFYDIPKYEPLKITESIQCSPMGWLEGNVLKIFDKNHIWYDKNAFHILLRTNVGMTNYGAVIKIMELNGKLVPTFEKNPSLKDIAFFPLPGGHLKFHINYDSVSKFYWMLSNQSTDSMVKPEILEKIPINERRHNLPNNERHRLFLYFSKNLIDWCPAKPIYASFSEKHSRNYPSFIISENDLYVVVKGADEEGLNSQYGNIISFFKIENFRNLIY